MVLSDVDGIMRLVLVGREGKRHDYFLKACREKGVELLFLDIEGNFEEGNLHRGDRVKIDPVSNDTIYLDQLNRNMQEYHGYLKRLSVVGGVHFLNSPVSIKATLDKRRCKRILKEKGILVTPILDFYGFSFEDLMEYLRRERISRIFIKPNLGSGAAGVASLKYNPKLDVCIMQTSLLKQEGYVNTKKVRTFTDRASIREMVDFLLKEGAVVERWIPKEAVGQAVYDLRVVYQFSHISYIQARGAKTSAITNLHLNNFPLTMGEIGLTEEKKMELEELCANAMACFDGLNSAGFDILLEKNTEKPYIIEINAQGDLMHRDVYGENRIYKEQVERMIRG
ncbi:STM4014 family protein [Filifactor villosus]|uniref:STM4014 family protein n=1 Tax=Filifactor villosus TaxID=29374 RepID=A0ABV9QMD6_9FIRM